MNKVDELKEIINEYQINLGECGVIYDKNIEPLAKDLNKYIKSLLQSQWISVEDVQIEKAEQQLIGWTSHRNGETLLDLISSMCLTKKEWGIMQEKYSLFGLTEQDKYEIDRYVNQLPQPPKE